MKIRITALLVLTAFALPFLGPTVVAQDTTVTGWKTSLVTDLTATQTAYSDSWTGGEAGSFSWVSNVNGAAEKQLSEKLNYKSMLKLSYGQTSTQDQETKSWSKPSKSTDLIDWENVGRITMHGFVDPYVAFRFESQFVDASVEQKKRYLNPMLLTESAGISKVLHEVDKNRIFTRLGFAVRQTLSTEIVDTALLSTESLSTSDGGLESVTDVTWNFGERLGYTGKLTLFKALFFSDKDAVAGTEFEDDWQAIDVNWENIFNASITKIITVNFYTQILYDKQVSKKARFKETLGFSFVFKLI